MRKRENHLSFAVCQAVGSIWKSRGFLTSAGTPIANGHIIAALLQAIHLPSKTATVHCSAHTEKTDSIPLGNNRAGRAKRTPLTFLQPVFKPAFIPD